MSNILYIGLYRPFVKLLSKVREANQFGFKIKMFYLKSMLILELYRNHLPVRTKLVQNTSISSLRFEYAN